MVFAANSIWTNERTGGFDGGRQGDAAPSASATSSPPAATTSRPPSPSAARASSSPTTASAAGASSPPARSLTGGDRRPRPRPDRRARRAPTACRSSRREHPRPTAVEAHPPRGGTRIKGPSALTGDWRRAVTLTWTLAYLEFRLRFFGSVLGYFWQLGRPLLMFGVYYVVFTEFVPLSGDVPVLRADAAVRASCSTSSSRRRRAARRRRARRENLVRKIHFPRIVIPLCVVVTADAQPAGELRRGRHLHGAPGRSPSASNWLAADPVRRPAVRLRRRPVDAAERAVRPLPRRPADLGRRPAGRRSTRRPILYTIDRGAGVGASR